MKAIELLSHPFVFNV